MKDRLKLLRNKLKLRQAKFGDRLGFKQSTVGTWELGSPVPRNVVLQICKEFNVRREWLETGEGEMFEPAPPPPTLDREAQRQFIIQLFESLPPDKQRLVLDCLHDLFDKFKNNDCD